MYTKSINKYIGVVIPVYKSRPNNSEQMLMKRIITLFSQYKIFIVCPIGMSIKRYGLNKNQEPELLEFDNCFFESTLSYNRLLLNIEFYKILRSKEVRYFLLHQLDSYSFSNNLDYWVSKKFDYIGAPWQNNRFLDIVFQSRYRVFFNISKYFNNILFSKKDWMVGNGGLSLRNVSKCIKVLKLFGKTTGKFYANEDVFWSIFVPLVFPFFKVPNRKDALGFAFEEKPEIMFQENNNSLPFGCHAFLKYNPHFWKNWIPVEFFDTSTTDDYTS